MVETPTVVILAPPNDLHAQCVAREVNQKSGISALIVDTVDFPTRWSFSLESPKGETCTSRVLLESRNARYDLSNVVGVWWRRPRRHAISSAIQESRIKQFCLDESRAMFEGWIHMLGRRVINPLANENAANQKPFQIHVAKQMGLRTPETLISNCPERVQDFINACKGKVIFKTLTTINWQMCETRPINRDVVRQLHTLPYSPVIFQEKISKKVDVRVTVVDQQLFPVLIEADHPNAQLDWRLDSAASVSQTTIPAEVEQKLLALMSTLGLRFGAIDLAIDFEGNYVFFEINPSGQYLWTEIHAQQPISIALAEALLAEDSEVLNLTRMANNHMHTDA